MKKLVFAVSVVLFGILFFGCKNAPATEYTINDLVGTWNFESEEEYNYGLGSTNVQVKNIYEFQNNGTCHMLTKLQDGIIREVVGIYTVDKENECIYIDQFPGQVLGGSEVSRSVKIYDYSFKNRKMILKDVMEDSELTLTKEKETKNHQKSGLYGMWLLADEDNQGYFQKRYFFNPDFTVTEEYSDDNGKMTTRIGVYKITGEKIVFDFDKEITVKDDPDDEDSEEHTETIIETEEKDFVLQDDELNLTTLQGTETFIKSCDYTRDSLVGMWKGTKAKDSKTVIYLCFNQDKQYTWYTQKNDEDKVLVSCGTYTRSDFSTTSTKPLYLLEKEADEVITCSYILSDSDKKLNFQKNADIYNLTRM